MPADDGKTELQNPCIPRSKGEQCGFCCCFWCYLCYVAPRTIEYFKAKTAGQSQASSQATPVSSMPMTAVESLNHLAPEKVIQETWWLYFLCWHGLGFGKIKPLCGAQAFCCCWIESFTLNCEEGQLWNNADGKWCEVMSVLCCLVTHMGFPWQKNASHTGSHVFNTGRENFLRYEEVTQNTKWLFYCCCCSVGCAEPRKATPYMIANSWKCCCLTGYDHTEAYRKHGLCYYTSTQCCLWHLGRCGLMEKVNPPICALCSTSENALMPAHDASVDPASSQA